MTALRSGPASAVYAKGTSVPVERSRSEIEKLLARYGATHFVSGWGPDAAQIGFEVHDRRVRFLLPFAKLDDKRFVLDGRRRRRPPALVHRAWEQDCRERWRALALVVKAKLEAVAANIATFEHEFLAHIVLPNGLTVGDVVTREIESAYRGGAMPPLLLGDGGTR